MNMMLDPLQYGLGAISGGLVGFTLGLFGGGGSILAVPLMVYVVGVPSAHMAIGTSAFAVAANAFTNLLGHARLGNVKWRCAGIYSVTGIIGAFIGSTFGKMVDGQKLLILFALLMLVVGVLMFRKRGAQGNRRSCRPRPPPGPGRHGTRARHTPLPPAHPRGRRPDRGPRNPRMASPPGAAPRPPPSAPARRES